jgi:hypothetical protein
MTETNVIVIHSGYDRNDLVRLPSITGAAPSHAGNKEYGSFCPKYHT